MENLQLSVLYKFIKVKENYNFLSLMKQTVKEFAEKIRKQNPQKYCNISDNELIKSYLKQFPNAKEKIDFGNPFSNRNKLIIDIVNQWEVQYKRPHYFYVYVGIVLAITILNLSNGNPLWYKVTFGALVLLSPIWIIFALRYFPRVNKAKIIITNIERNSNINIKAAIEFEYRTRMFIKCEVVDIYIGNEVIRLDTPYKFIHTSTKEFVS